MNISINAVNGFAFVYNKQQKNPKKNIITNNSNFTQTKNVPNCLNFYAYAQTVAFKGNHYENLKKILLDNGSLTLENINSHLTELKKISTLDFENVKMKYEEILNYLKRQKTLINEEKYKEAIDFNNIKNVLLHDDLKIEDLKELITLKDLRPYSNWVPELMINEFVKTIFDYENFENIPTSAQRDFIDIHRFVVPTKKTLSRYELEEIDDSYSINKFQYINTIRHSKGREEFIQLLESKRVNIPCKAIPVDREKINNILSENFIINLEQSLLKTDLSKYEEGFPLKYSRKQFMNDFNELTQNLSNSDRNNLYKYFQFNINTNDDIINYPNPNTDTDNISTFNDKDTLIKAQELVNKFMQNNTVILEPEDRHLQDVINQIIEVFPEFIPTIGKEQHRHGSVDFHTFDDLKRISKSPEFNNLSVKEKGILFIATLFHDFAKEKGKVDPEHPTRCALMSKEIVKKLPIALDDKERIYNFIKHSHWYTDNESEYLQAFYFRRPNDFKLAQIFSRADSNSSSFTYNPTQRRLDLIQENINKINRDGILIFADNIPADDSKFDTNIYGVKYLDFRDPEALVDKYGYPKGTKVKDLHFFCHGSDERTQKLQVICDDSKDICLSTILLNGESKFDTFYTAMNAYIMSGNNANIVTGGKSIANTGHKRDLDYAKEGMYQTNNHVYFKDKDVSFLRKQIPDLIRKELKLSDEEYLELYNKVCNINEFDKIPDVILSGSKIIKSEELKQVINKIHAYLVEKSNTKNSNEFIIYNPKIEAKIINHKHRNINSIKHANTPVVLV